MIAAKSTTRNRARILKPPLVCALAVYCTFLSCMEYLLTKNWLLHVSDSFGCDNGGEYTTSIKARLLDEGIGRYQSIIDIRGLSGASLLSWRTAKKGPQWGTSSAASSMRFRDWYGLRSFRRDSGMT